MHILQELNYKSKLYKIRLIIKELNLFNFQKTSNNWDKLAKAMEEDVHKEEEFVFVHPTSNSTEYSRRYIQCPINGNTVLFVGKMKEPGDFAIVRITLHSQYYKEPYLVIEDYKKSFSKPEIPAEMVRSAFNWKLSKLGLEVVLDPWESDGEPIYWMMDSWVSYMHELRLHPEVGAMCMGFEEALHVFKEKKAVEKAMKEKKDKESNKPKKKKIKSDNIMDYIVKGDKAYIVKILHILIDGLTAPIDIARPIRFLCDKQVFRDKEEFRLPYKAFIKEFPMLEKYISDTAYNRLISPNNKPYKNSIKYQNLKNFFILG